MKPEVKKTYDFVVNSDGWVAGYRKKKGDVVTLTKGQAKYEDVTLKAGAAKPAAKNKEKAS